MEKSHIPSVPRARPSAEQSPFNIPEDDETAEKRRRRTQRDRIDEAQNDEPSADEDDLSLASSDCSHDRRKSLDPIVQEDIAKFEESFKGITRRYKILSRIGEGTFSTVYKAEDLQYDQYYNDWDVQSPDANVWVSPPLQKGMRQRRKPRYVAIKKIYVTSSPIRIQNELELLNDLKWCKDVCPLITAFRHQDQVVAVLPYYRHQDFRSFFSNMLPEQIQVYFQSLFSALAAVHKQGILHRDIKPTNFLYDILRQRGVLVDFGLAEREGTDCSYCTCNDTPSRRRVKVENSYAAQNPSINGYPKSDTRPSKRANRAGTRGFRAPEVLLKCTSQTTKIDIWSAGVILLTILSQRFPFFNSTDDVEALIEISSIFGQRRMKTTALLHGSVFETTIPTIGEKGYPWEKLITWSQDRPNKGDGIKHLSSGEKEAVRFLERCMELDPRRRISAEEALHHPFLAETLGSASGEDEMQFV